MQKNVKQSTTVESTVSATSLVILDDEQRNAVKRQLDELDVKASRLQSLTDMFQSANVCQHIGQIVASLDEDVFSRLQDGRQADANAVYMDILLPILKRGMDMEQSGDTNSVEYARVINGVKSGLISLIAKMPSSVRDETVLTARLQEFIRTFRPLRQIPMEIDHLFTSPTDERLAAIRNAQFKREERMMKRTNELRALLAPHSK